MKQPQKDRHKDKALLLRIERDLFQKLEQLAADETRTISNMGKVLLEQSIRQTDFPGGGKQ